MTYMISRDGQQYGPYTLADLQRYVSSGEVLLSDMAISEGMIEPLPVSQVVGSIPVPPAVAPISVTAAVFYPDPPNLHWGLVLLFGILTFGLFSSAWTLVLTIWVRKLVPTSKALYYGIAHIACLGCVVILSFIAGATHQPNPFVSLLQITSGVLAIVCVFSLKNALEMHYNSDEPMGLSLSGVMTFFFQCIYLQYHLNDIVRRKKLDAMSYASA